MLVFSPGVVCNLIRLCLDVGVSSGSGLKESFTYECDKGAGASVESSLSILLKGVSIVMTVLGPTVSEISKFPKGVVLIGHLGVMSDLEQVEALAKEQITAFALELLQRITRAQHMDILSSQ